jgi:hypothetical protein
VGTFRDSGARALARWPRSHRLAGMISIPITEEVHKALKATMPGIDQAPTSKGRDGTDADMARS